MSWTLRTDPSGFRTRWSDAAASRYRAAGYWRDETLADVARRTRDAAPDHPLLVERDRSITRAEAWAASSRLAAFFFARGLRPGDVVSFQLPNWTEAAIIALAARRCGLVLAPIPPNYREAEVGYILQDCRAKVLFAPHVFRKHDHRRMLAGLRPEVPSLRDVVEVRGDGTAGLGWSEAVAGPPVRDEALPRLDPSAAMVVMYTSGTTGRPKGVIHTHYTFDYRVRTIVEAWSIAPSDVIFMPSPVTHITGAYWAVDIPWVSGATSVLMDVWSPEEAIDCIEKHRCTVTGGATPFLRQLLDTAVGRPGAMASLRIFFCGGTTVSPDLIREAAATHPHCLFFRAYGSTEMPTTTLGIRDRADAALGAETDGEVVPPTEVKIVDLTRDAPVRDGEEGEILVRGPEQLVGYVHPEDNDAAFDADGYFRMGDLGRRVHGRYLVITGRKKDIIIRSGENLSPKEVEDVLAVHPAVADVAIVAMPSRETGEKACAFIVLRPGHTIDLAEIRRTVERAGLARQKCPEHLVVVDELPRVPSGKISKDVLRARAKEIAEQGGT
ncbi:MAG TPA: AMP-binding protein [Candidatus Limnocylindria bacterium]|nr:AMP-binding protein [Candidatus Limnocylindria bacterium]